MPPKDLQAAALPGFARRLLKLFWNETVSGLELLDGGSALSRKPTYVEVMSHPTGNALSAFERRFDAAETAPFSRAAERNSGSARVELKQLVRRHLKWLSTEAPEDARAIEPGRL
jgi:hypothetical protein